eukprot:jgi/Undpi1/10436/HiC_scaffold_29.g12886.m1
MARKTLASAFIAVTMVAAGMPPAARVTNDRDVRITYAEEDGTVNTSSFDLLVVACDPAALSGILDAKTALEERVESALETYTLGTSLWEVWRKEGEGNRYTIRMSPDQLSAGDGDVYLIRDEPRTRTASSHRHTLVTAYQFANSSVSEEEFTKKAVTAMDGSSREYDWLGLEPEAKLLEVETKSNYFPHFSQKDIQAGLPWAVLDAQGNHNTIYVSSFGSFESVLAVYEYGNMLENTTQVQNAFEKARLASIQPRVAIIGAGPSGLLFASQQLKRAGLEDITIFEKQDTWGGKTRTYSYDAPGSPGQEKVAVEMGPCYLGNTYKAFSEMLVTRYGLKKPARINYGREDPGPRAIFNAARNEFLRYPRWILENPDGTQMSTEEFTAGIATYVAAHYSLAGWSTDTGVPIPHSQPKDLPSMTFFQYLESIGIGHLKNVFSYGHSAQGYGDINVIPAYYGLIWVTPDVFTAQLDFAASISEQLAEKAEDAEARIFLRNGASTMRNGSRVARKFEKSTEREFERGVTPSAQQAAELAARCNTDVLAETNDKHGSADVVDEREGAYLIQEGWGEVWTRIIDQDQLHNKIKLGVRVLNIERSGLGNY